MTTQQNQEITAPLDTGKLNKTEKMTLYVVVATQFLWTFAASALNLSVLEIGEEFHTGATSLTWVINAYMILLGAFSVPWARLADLRGRRNILLAGLGLFALCALLAGFAPSMGFLIGVRVVQGIASAMVISTAVALMLEDSPSSRRGRMMGYTIGAAYVGHSVGPVLGGMLNDWLGWRSIFFVTALFTAITFVVTLREIPKRPRLETVPGLQDKTGNLLYIFAILLLMSGLSSWHNYAWGRWVALAGAVLLTWFILHERRVEKPVIELSLFTHDRGFTCSNVAAFLNFSAISAVSYTMSLYLETVKGLPASTAGLVLLCQPIILAISSPVFGRLADKRSPFRLAAMGMFVSAAGLFLLSRLSVVFPLWLVMTSLCVIGLGMAMFSSPNITATMYCLDNTNYGVGTSLNSTVRSLGQIISMVVISFIFGICIGDVVLSAAAPGDLSSAMSIALCVYAVICLVGAGFSLVPARSYCNLQKKAVAEGETHREKGCVPAPAER